MVIRGNSRGNGRQLAQYLLDKKDNSRVWILDIEGMDNPQARDLHHALFDMSVTAELTNGTKGLYHAQINPDGDASQRMTPEDWYKAADILGRYLGYEGQRRVIVMHEKKGRVHAHVVWERYDFEKGTLKPDSFNFVAQDKARQEMEQLFRQKETPKRNKHQPESKATLTDLWSRAATGQAFIRSANEKGYILAAGTPRHPFMVIDKEARSFDLVRQLKGIRIKEVRQKMRGIDLISEKQAIELAKKKGEKEADTFETKKEPTPKKNTSQEKKEAIFTINADDISDPRKTLDPKPYIENKQDMFSVPLKEERNKEQPLTSKAAAYMDNKKDLAGEKGKKNEQEIKKDEDVAARKNKALERLKEIRRTTERKQNKRLDRE